MELITERLILRPFVQEDEAEALRLFMDPEFMTDPIEPELTLKAAKRRFDGYLRNQETLGYSKLAVRWTEAPEIIGYCGYGVVPMDGADRPELAYRLLPAARGKGVATEAAQVAIEWGFEAGMDRIDAIVRHNNAPSRRVLEKLGLRYLHDMDVEGEPWMLYRLERRTTATV